MIEVLVVIAILSLLIGIVLAAVQRVRAASAKLHCQNSLRQLALASQNFHTQQGYFPIGWISDRKPKNYSYTAWTSQLLPNLEQESVWREVEAAFASDPDRRKFYGHPAHAALLGKPMRAFACASDGRVIVSQTSSGGVGLAFTSYLGVAGRNGFQADGVLIEDQAIRIAEISDGTSQTIMIGERPPPADLRMGWWYRGWGLNKNGVGEMILGVRESNFSQEYPDCPTGPFPFQSRRISEKCHLFQFWSLHPGGANFAFADGSVHFLKYSASDILVPLATRAAGDVVDIN